MRASSAIILAFLILMGASGAQASDKVLLPACEGNNCAKPNLGLNTESAPPERPADPIAPPAPPSTTSKIINSISNLLPNLGLGPSAKTKQETQPVDKPPTPGYRPAAQPTVPTPVAHNITPGGHVAAGVTTHAEKMSDLMKAVNVSPDSVKPNFSDPQLKTIYEEQQKLKNRPPLIISEIDPGSFMAPSTRNYPGSISIAVTPGYMWGANDVEQINRTLGYSPAEIPSHCQLRLDGKVTTSEGLYLINVYAGQQGTVRYPGTFQSIDFSARGVCNKPQGDLPPSGSILRRAGNKLSVQLADNVACSNLPEKGVSAIEIQYNGDGSIVCKKK